MTEIELNPEFVRALALMEAGERHLFVTGRAGTGKSTLLSHYRATTEQESVVLAPTGVAALNVGGQTVHRFFGFGLDVTPEKVRKQRRAPRRPELYERLETIVIDEASMLRADLLDCVDAFLRKHGPKRRVPFGGVQMVFVGDLYQLPPVVTPGEREIFRTLYDTPYFFSAKAIEEADLEIVELEKVYRQKDAGFVALLNRIRNNSVDAADIARLNERVEPAFAPRPGEFAVTLTTTNRNADRINAEQLARLPAEPLVSHADVFGDFDRQSYPTAAELVFKPGAQVMLVSNDAADRWVNGSIGVVEGLATGDENEDEEDDAEKVLIRLRDGGERVAVGRHTWELVRFTLDRGKIVTEPAGTFTQYPFRLAWAVTIHKSQGKTFERIVIDLERGAFESGQTYVALSRCTAFGGIVLKRPIRAGSIRADWRVRKFLAGSRWREAEQAMPTEDKVAAIRAAIERRRPLTLTYLRPDDTCSERVVVPVSVGQESYAGKQFLGMRAYCTVRRDERMFRVDRILTLAPAGEAESAADRG